MSAPKELTPDALQSKEPVYPAFIDKLRTTFQTKLGWGPLEARGYFEVFKAIAKREGGEGLEQGFLLREICTENGVEAATVAFRAIHWLRNEREIKRAHRKALR